MYLNFNNIYIVYEFKVKNIEILYSIILFDTFILNIAYQIY